MGLIGIYSVAVIGLNMLVGSVGLISLCHASFFAIGSYSLAILTNNYQLPFWIALPCSGLISSGIGFLLGFPILRFKGLYLAMVTLGFAIILNELLLMLKEFTGGSAGLAVQRPLIFGISFKSDLAYYYIIVMVTLILGVMGSNILKTKTGRAFIAIKDFESGASSLGIDTARYKIIAFSLSAFYAGIGGGLFAPLIKYIAPEIFNVSVSINFLAMAVIGGLGSILGSIFGAALFVMIPELLRGVKDLQLSIFALLLFGVILFMPSGLNGVYIRLLLFIKKKD
jgi:branched-chain amino acid transport system permease protein